ncbi:MAG: hypothetical protein H6601_06370 [Flavobacteriales bacterium]|nr:hypothetical protein [Flavobacteriales bacterium]
MRHILPLLLSVFFLSPVIAQEKIEKETSEPKKEQPAKEQKQEEKKIKAESKGPKAKVPYRFMANIHGGIGLMNYFGDLRDKQGTTVHRIGILPGYNFGIGANVTNYLEVNINAMLGKLNWNENPSEHDVPRNFQAKTFTVGANLVYNFKNVILSPTGITPFISIGVGYSDFDSYSDLQTTVKDQNGNDVTYSYNYWDDGLIRNVDQSAPQSDNVQVLERDYKYETRLNEYPIATYNIPVGAGFDFNANRNVALRLGAYYYFTGTDMMDNVSGGSTPVISNDGYIYTSMSLFIKFDPFKKKAPKVDEAGAAYEGIGELVDEDSDGDGVSDFVDQCGGTPKGLVVDEKGCPADGDGDGIPDYRDKEPKTTAGRIVNPDGVAISYEEIYKTYGKDTISLKRADVNKDWLFSQKSVDPDYTVHVGTYTNYDIPTQIKLRLAKMEDLVEHKVNDSISVFTVGNFKTFEEAEQRQNELIKSGIDEAFGVNDDYIPEVGVEIGVVGFEKNSKQSKNGVDLDQIPNVDVLQYGVELREYRLRIQLDKLSKLIAQHGVEMKTTEGGLKVYTIGSFKTFAEAEALQRQVEQLGVKNPVISAKLNNEGISIEDAQKKESEMQGEQND